MLALRHEAPARPRAHGSTKHWDINSKTVRKLNYFILEHGPSEKTHIHGNGKLRGCATTHDNLNLNVA
eukprot:5692143-Pyramimonas_sp.AAC.1